jgi:hypothetical protein
MGYRMSSTMISDEALRRRQALYPRREKEWVGACDAPIDFIHRPGHRAGLQWT